MTKQTRFSILALVLVAIIAIVIVRTPPPDAQLVGVGGTTQRETYLPIVSKPFPNPKACIAWAYYGQRQTDDAERLGISCFYTWGPRPLPDAENGAKHIPMIWGDIHLASARQLIDADEAGYILFLNEPNLASQANLSPLEAAYLWGIIKNRYPKAIFVGPCVSHDDYLWHDWSWTREWYATIESLGLAVPDVGCLHSYIASEPPSALVDSFFDLMAEVGGPQTAWMTEFAACTPELISDMINTYRDDLRIERYFYFTIRGWPDNPQCLNLIDENGELTIAGRAWIDEHRMR